MVAFGPEADAEITLKSADWTPENGRISPPPAYPPKRREVGQGLQAGKTYVEGEMLPKVVVVVDREINPCRLDDVWQALGARWQPYPATAIIEETKGLPLDPSLRQPLQTSKIVIDATPQLPGEGGPEHMAGNSKSLFVKACPEGLLRADALMDELGL